MSAMPNDSKYRRRFELLKDLPDAKAGCIYKLNEEGDWYICYDNSGKWSVAYQPKIVENNPSWFKEIKDTEQSSKPLTEFDEESAFNLSRDKLYNGNGSFREYRFPNYEAYKIYKEANQKLYERDKQPTANDVLNSEGKDWEILKCHHNGGNIHDYDYKICLRGTANPCSIYSVKRLSDGEVFSVGDDCYVENIKGYSNFDIVRFEIYDDRSMTVCSAGSKYSLPLVKKTKPSQQSKRIEVRHCESHDRFRGNNSDTFWYQFSTSKPIVLPEFEKIKSAIEKILNNE